MTTETAQYPINFAIHRDANVNPADRLSMTLFLATALHAICILGLGFNFEDEARLEAPPSLEVILVQKQNQAKIEKADYLAQISQDGGGEADDRLRPSEAFAATEPSIADGIAPQPLQQRQQTTVDQQTKVLTQLFAEQKIVQINEAKNNNSQHQATQDAQDSTADIAKLTAELNLAIERYAKRPKKMVLTARTHEYIPASYMHNWVEKVERIGNLNYPSEIIIRKLEGTLILEVEIKWDGSIVNINMLNSSGNSILDEAAKRIVKLSTPFEPFPKPLREIADHLQIVRTWQFKRSGLTTN